MKNVYKIMNYSWVLVLNSYLMIAVLGLLCTSRLSPPSSPLMNEKQVERGREREWESKLPLSCSQNVFCAIVSQKLHHGHKPLQATVALQSVWCMACCTSLSDGLLRWTLTYSTLQNSHPPNGTAPNIHTLCQVCVSCEKWALCCLRLLNLKVSSLD